MSAMTRVKEFIESLPGESRFIGETAIKELRQNGTSWEWLETALNIKSKEDWSKYGFGLMFTDSFRAQVQKKLNKQKSLKSDELWTETEKEQSHASHNVAFDKDSFIEVKRGSETFLIKSRESTSVAPKSLSEMTQDEFYAMVIEQNRAAELFCARSWPDTYGDEIECIRRYEIEDREMTDKEIALQYFRCR